MDAKQWMTLGSMASYLVLVIVIGLVYSRRNKTGEEFYLGGRGLGPWVTAMSAEASDMSGWLLMGLPGAAYLLGLADAAWTAIGLAIGTYFNWLITAKRLRNYTQVADNSITLPDFFSNRYMDKNKILMNIAALFILIFFVIYTASGFVACGKLFESLFGFDYVTSMFISAAIVVIYTIVGGFLAESIVDFVQGSLMLIALGVILTLGLVATGGVGDAIRTVDTLPGYLSLFTEHGADGAASSLGWIRIVSGLSWGLGYFGIPHVLLRFMAIRKADELKKSRRIGMVWVVLSLGIAVMLGVVGRALYLSDPALTGTGSETIFIVMCKRLLDTGLLPIIGGIMLSGILAAQISSADSQLLVASSAISQNFFKGLIKPNATDKQVMWVARITIVGVALAAIVFALNPNGSIFEIVSFAWAGFGATFGPLILFSLYWKRANLAGALAGMVAGGGMVLLWKLVLSRFGGVFAMYELLPAFLFSSLAIVVVSLMTKPPRKEVVEQFEAYEALNRS